MLCRLLRNGPVPGLQDLQIYRNQFHLNSPNYVIQLRPLANIEVETGPGIVMVKGEYGRIMKTHAGNRN
jgi:hypothetical protein